MSISINRRGTAVLVAACALLVGSLSVAAAADASTLYACVKKNGTARVFTKKPKCKKGESKITWGSAGPAGKNGANGANGGAGKDGANGKNGENGANGADGAVAGYSASRESAVNILSGTIGSPITVVTKKLPAGSYIVSAKTVIAASDTANGATWVAQCQLFDGTTSDLANASGAIVTNFLFHTGSATVPLGFALSTTTETTVTLACTHVWDTSGTGNFEWLRPTR
jgi:hypothetical protein